MLANGERGDCRVRINLDGKLMTLVYGKPCAIHVDPIEKKPIYHMLPGSGAFSIATAGCNLRCKFCQNWTISQRKPEETRNEDWPPVRVLQGTIATKCKSIAYTYSEPIIFYEYMLDTAKLAHKNGIKNICVTAGFVNKGPLEELCPYLDAANIDLKSIRDSYYREICDGELQPVLDTIKIAKERGVWVELTNLIVPTLNDKKSDLSELCDWIIENLGPDVPLHFSRFWPMYQLKNLPPTPVETLEKAWDIAKSKGIHYVYMGNVPGHKGNSTFCPSCGQMVIGRRGYQIFEYQLDKEGRCTKCSTMIPGVWN